MRRWKRLVCWFRGHKITSNGYVSICDRCDCDDYVETPREDWFFMTLPEHIDLWRWLLGRRWHRLIEWLSVCPYCGKRCCDIPNDDDHLPF